MFDVSAFVGLSFVFAIGMLIWNTVEVGRNDAANIVNAVFGARIMKRKHAVQIAGIAVILGAWASNPVMETVRKGIFDPSLLSIKAALAIYLSVYITNTVLLYCFSAFGMPVSTTATLIFSLLGGALAVGGTGVIQWDSSAGVLTGIVVSILISGTLGFIIHRAFRGALGQDSSDAKKVLLHGPWIGGAMLTGLIFFMVMKGMKNVAFIKLIQKTIFETYGSFGILALMWGALTLVIWAVIKSGGEKFARNLFPVLAVLGMLSMAFAFGQNDLANCASPGVAIYMIAQHGDAHTSSGVAVPGYLLFGCGVLLAIGMSTKTAQRVTRAEVNTGSQGDVVRLYAPNWCVSVAGFFVGSKDSEEALAPEPKADSQQKVQHYDALRAAVITSVSASVIALASGQGLPVSTTYVSFAAVVATGWADKIFVRGDAHLKMGRTIWVVFCWFASAFIAAAACGVCALLLYYGGVFGLVAGLAINLFIRYIFKKRADLQEQKLQDDATERKKKMYSQGGEAVFASEQDDD